MIGARKTITGAVAALTLVGALAGTTAPAAAWYHHGWGGPAAVGLLGGLAAGAIIGGATRPYYGGGYPGYGYGPEPAYEPCYLTRRPVYDAYGEFAGYRRVRVCN